MNVMYHTKPKYVLGNGLYKKNVTNFVTDHETKGKSPVVNCTPNSP